MTKSAAIRLEESFLFDEKKSRMDELLGCVAHGTRIDRLQAIQMPRHKFRGGAQSLEQKRIPRVRLRLKLIGILRQEIRNMRCVYGYNSERAE